jgi:hypothetical protein
LADLYRSLSPQESEQMAGYVLELLDHNWDDEAEMLLFQLACLSPSGLRSIHKALVTRERFYPGIAYRNAESEIAQQVIKLLTTRASDLNVSHILELLACHLTF